MYKALSLQYEGRLDLSIIGDKDEELLKQFNIKDFPSLLVMAGMKDAGNGQQQMQIQPYTGKKFQFKAINKFLNRFAAPVATAISVSTQAALKKATGSSGNVSLRCSKGLGAVLCCQKKASLSVFRGIGNKSDGSRMHKLRSSMARREFSSISETDSDMISVMSKRTDR